MRAVRKVIATNFTNYFFERAAQKGADKISRIIFFKYYLQVKFPGSNCSTPEGSNVYSSTTIYKYWTPKESN